MICALEEAAVKNIHMIIPTVTGAHNIGAGIDLNNSFELNVFYHHGFTNFLPNRDAAVEINKLSFLK